MPEKGDITMNEISNVLVTVPFPEEQMKKLEQAFAPAKVWILSNKDTEGISRHWSTPKLRFLMAT